MFFYVYIIQSELNSEFYIGFTADLRKRIKEHNNGLSKSTNHYKPWELIYYEACLNCLDAVRRERYFKTNQGRRFFKRRIREFIFNQR